jgi:type IV secretion system protein VirB8
MSDSIKFFQEYIKSGQYFLDAKKWYNMEYLYPIVHRSILLIVFFITISIFSVIFLTTYSLLPIIHQIKYTLMSDDIDNKTATIIHANNIPGDAILSIADILVKNYVTIRESYNYNDMKNQFLFIQKNSTKIIFKRFSNMMNIDNPSSPVIRYQKNYNRNVEIISTTHYDKHIIVKFKTITKNLTYEIFEDITWEVDIYFEIDTIDNVVNNSKFNFIVTDYKLKLLNDNRVN